MITFEEYLEEGKRWQRFMQMMADFHQRKNIDTDFQDLAYTANWASRVVKDNNSKKKLKAFAAEIAKVDMSSVAGRRIIAKLEKEVAPILKSVNATIKFEMEEGFAEDLKAVPKMKDDALVRLWNKAKDEQVSPQFGRLLKRVRMEIKKRGLKVKP